MYLSTLTMARTTAICRWGVGSRCSGQEAVLSAGTPALWGFHSFTICSFIAEYL